MLSSLLKGIAGLLADTILLSLACKNRCKVHKIGQYGKGNSETCLMTQEDLFLGTVSLILVTKNTIHIHLKKNPLSLGIKLRCFENKIGTNSI